MIVQEDMPKHDKGVNLLHIVQGGEKEFKQLPILKNRLS